MLSFKLSADNCAQRIVTLQSHVFRFLGRCITGCAIGGLALACCGVQAETTPLSQQMARSVMQNWPDGHYSTDQGEWKWDYRLGIVLNGMDAAWHNTADPAYYDYVKTTVDQYIADDGSIRTYEAKDHSLDSILLGKQLLLLYEITQDAKYYKAAKLIREQLATQPRNATEGKGNGDGELEPGEQATIWLQVAQGLDPFDKENWCRAKVHSDSPWITETADLQEDKGREWTSAQNRTSVIELDPATPQGTEVHAILDCETYSYTFTPDVRYGTQPLYQPYQFHRHQLYLWTWKVP